MHTIHHEPLLGISLMPGLHVQLDVTIVEAHERLELDQDHFAHKSARRVADAVIYVCPRILSGVLAFNETRASLRRGAALPDGSRSALHISVGGGR